MEKVSWFDRYFYIGVIAKGLNSVLEILGGLPLLFFSQSKIFSLIVSLTYEELSEDPRDLVANYILKLASGLSVGQKIFAGIYLVSHGIIKLGLVVGLLKRRLWAYPLSMVVFGLFVVYQIYKFSYNHSAILAALSVFDLGLILATWFEYKKIKMSLQTKNHD